MDSVLEPQPNDNAQNFHLELGWNQQDAVSQGGYQAQCKKFKPPAPGENTQCPNIQKPVCGTDGQTYKNLCEFCKVAMEQNGQIGYKHDGKC
ncbi:serine protease inhibitor Kazal-type 12-like [Vombatus ursinus]|uniref:serine protease inhibitor Kazal-type 12-like n=1 Tax=Vombatus ursinus TaxID=29139 RepID=UPI000FFD539A|nr:serine protease inhibitor Kazal-type 12-like [Vombatus ursinus]